MTGGGVVDVPPETGAEAGVPIEAPTDAWSDANSCSSTCTSCVRSAISEASDEAATEAVCAEARTGDKARSNTTAPATNALFIRREDVYPLMNLQWHVLLDCRGPGVDSYYRLPQAHWAVEVAAVVDGESEEVAESPSSAGRSGGC